MNEQVRYKWLPSEPSDEMLRATDSFMNPLAKVLYERMWQAAPASLQPSAKTTWKDGDTVYTCEFTGAPSIIPPLYINQQPKLEPLSESEIRRLWGNGMNAETIVEFARLIENAHGIKTE
jgi:hypothetical protein